MNTARTHKPTQSIRESSHKPNKRPVSDDNAATRSAKPMYTHSHALFILPQRYLIGSCCMHVNSKN